MIKRIVCVKRAMRQGFNLRRAFISRQRTIGCRAGPDLIVLLRGSEICRPDLACRSQSCAGEKREKERNAEWTTAGQCRGRIKIVDLHENERRLSSFNARRACQTASRR